MSAGMYTPWGNTSTNWQLEEGVFWVQNAERGGLLIDKSKAAEILSDKACTIGKRWDNFLAFDQDNDMMVVFYEHPELYPWIEEELTESFAEESLRRDHSDYFLA